MIRLAKTIATPLLITFAFILTSFMPLIQGIVLTYDGGLLALTNWLIFQESPVRINATNWIINFPLSVLFLVLLFRAATIAGSVMFSFFSFLFVFCFLVFLTGDRFGGVEPYFLFFAVISIVTGLILSAVTIVKARLTRTKKPAYNIGLPQ